MVEVTPPIKPMLAKAVGEQIPVADKYWYEPKWDGFRALVFRLESGPVIQSRSGEDITYCFPEVAEQAEQLPIGTVLDGELIIAAEGRLWFERLTMRIRPRSEAGGWKIAELAAEYPAQFVGFDCLAVPGQDLMQAPFADRRHQLLHQSLPAKFSVTPLTADPAEAAQWFTRFEGAGLDGVMVKDVESTYQPGKRTMLKVKHIRTADVVIGGWRAHKAPGPAGEPQVGSLLLGLYDDEGNLNHVGVAASFSAKRRQELTDELGPKTLNASDQDLSVAHPWAKWAQAQEARGRQPGMQSRWSAGKDLTFNLLAPDLVGEVKYDHMEGARFRHVTRLLRFRPDREPHSCTYSQLDRPVAFDLATILSSGSTQPDFNPA